MTDETETELISMENYEDKPKAGKPINVEEGAP
jgi:hypothetical protein